MPRTRAHGLAPVALLFLCATSVARADRPLTIEPTDSQHELVIDLKVELPIVILSAAILGTSQLLANPYGPTMCKWCDTRSSLNSFDAAGMSAFAGADQAKAGTGSDLLAYAGMPVLTLGLALAASLDSTHGLPGKYRARRFGIDVLLMTEALASSLAVMQMTKFVSQRRRPFAIDEPTDAERAVDANLSFFSGHTVLAFSLATSAGTIASLRHERLAPLVWVVGLLAATATGMSRVAADQHFATDVLAGSAVGAGIGALVPILHRVKTKVPLRLTGSASSMSGALALAGAF